MTNIWTSYVENSSYLACRHRNNKKNTSKHNKIKSFFPPEAVDFKLFLVSSLPSYFFNPLDQVIKLFGYRPKLVVTIDNFICFAIFHYIDSSMSTVEHFLWNLKEVFSSYLFLCADMNETRVINWIVFKVSVDWWKKSMWDVGFKVIFIMQFLWRH